LPLFLPPYRIRLAPESKDEVTSNLYKLNPRGIFSFNEGTKKTLCEDAKSQTNHKRLIPRQAVSLTPVSPAPAVFGLTGG
jgi:hypothetical protein